MNDQDFNEQDAQDALRRLASHANSHPTRHLEVESIRERSLVSGERRPEWVRFAVAAAVVAVLTTTAVMLRRGSTAPEIAAQAGTPAFESGSGGAGFEERSVWPNGSPPESPPIQRQYAQDGLETERWLVAIDFSNSTIGPAFRLNSLQPSTLPGSPVATTSPDVSQVPAAFPDVGEVTERSCNPFRSWMNWGIESPPASLSVPPTSVTIMGATTVPATDPLVAQPPGELCHSLALGSSVLLLSKGLSDSELLTASEHTKPADDGNGTQIDASGLPEGFSEITVGVIGDAFVPMSTWSASDWRTFAWFLENHDAGTNPVLTGVDLVAASFGMIADGGTDLVGQRLNYEDAADAAVGDHSAIVQSMPGAVAVVWRVDGSLYRYLEVGTGANETDTVARANQLLPTILEAASTAPPTTTPPAETTVPMSCVDTTVLDLPTSSPSSGPCTAESIPEWGTTPTTIMSDIDFGCEVDSESVATTVFPSMPATTSPVSVGPTPTSSPDAPPTTWVCEPDVSLRDQAATTIGVG